MTELLDRDGPRDDGRAAGETEREVIGMARGGSLNLVGNAINQAATMGVALVIARVLGRSDFGRYAQAYAFLSLLNLLALSGFRNGLTRFVAVHRAENDEGAMRGTIRLGVSLTAVSSALFGVLLFAGAPWLVAHAFHDANLVDPLRFVAGSLFFQTMTDAMLSATTGFRTMRYYAVIGWIVEPVLRIAITVGLLAAGVGLRGTMAALVVSNAVAAVLAAFALRRLVGRPSRQLTRRYNVRELFSFSTVSWLGSLASTGLIWADTLILGALKVSSDVGVYNAATRLVTLATFVMPPINASFAPRIADLYHRGRLDALARVYGVATSWILRLSLPAFVACIALPRELLGVFGRQFEVGALCTVILACGKLVDAGTGPCAQMLNMSGKVLLNTVDNVGVLILNVALNLWLIPRHGIVGAALAWAISLWIVNIARVIQVWIVMRMLPFDVGVLKGVAAGDLALLVSVVIVHVTSAPLRLPLALTALVVTYVATIWALGLTDEDRLVLGSLLRRRGGGRRGPGHPAPAVTPSG